MLIDKNMKKMDLLEAIEKSPNTLTIPRYLACFSGFISFLPLSVV